MPRQEIQRGGLADQLAAPGIACPIPSTHDKLHEAHYWWHEMAEDYHEPNGFRSRRPGLAHNPHACRLFRPGLNCAFRQPPGTTGGAVRRGPGTS